jgi:hypothetical protein
MFTLLRRAFGRSPAQLPLPFVTIPPNPWDLPNDYLPDASLDERMDDAEIALDAYTESGGTTGNDRDDAEELIVDLLHMLDANDPLDQAEASMFLGGIFYRWAEENRQLDTSTVRFAA